jgi:hypothetical protein
MFQHLHKTFQNFGDLWYTHAAPIGENYLGKCFGYSDRTPGELISGFFVGRAYLQREALIGKK